MSLSSLDEVLGQGGSPPRAVFCQVFPVPGVDVEGLYVSLAHITVAELRAACLSFARNKLAVEDVFRNSSILHVADLVKPAEPALAEHSEHRREAGLGKDFCVWDSVLP